MKLSMINVKERKLDRLIDLLLSNIDRRLKYDLYIASCYFNIDSAAVLLKLIVKHQLKVKISSVNLYINRSEAVLIDQEYFDGFIEQFEGFSLKILIIDEPNFFHSKLYCLTSSDYIGNIVVGSANLTKRGLTDKSGNTESLIATQDSKTIKAFVKSLDKLRVIELDQVRNFQSRTGVGLNSFKYGLLNRGYFVHKWTDNLTRILSVRYNLNSYGREQIINDEIREMGFEIETATISKNYFDLGLINQAKEMQFSNLIPNFGIESYLGYWLPDQVFEFVFTNSGFYDFKYTLEAELLSQLKNISILIRNDILKLVKLKVIDVNENKDKYSLLEQNVKELLACNSRLQRVFSQYKLFRLPFDLSDTENINDIFDQMLYLIQDRTKKNKSQKTFLKAYEMKNIDYFDEEISRCVEEFFQSDFN